MLYPSMLSLKHSPKYGSSNPPVGIQVIKVGATTGATSGNITNSCYDFLIGNTTYLCQVKVSGYSGPGDSGSAAFQDIGSNQVILWGIVHSGAGNGSHFNFTPINTVIADLLQLGASISTY